MEFKDIQSVYQGLSGPPPEGHHRSVLKVKRGISPSLGSRCFRRAAKEGLDLGRGDWRGVEGIGGEWRPGVGPAFAKA